MLELYDQIEEAVSSIKEKWDRQPHAGIVLGTGLGSLVEQIDVEASIEYEEITNFARSTATSMRRSSTSSWMATPIRIMTGRTFPISTAACPSR